MKKFNKIFGMTAVAVATFSLASCQNELDGYVPGGNTGVDGVTLVKAPDVVAWSGQQTLGNTLSAVNTYATRGVNVNVNEWDKNYNCENATKELSKEDITKIIELLSKGTPTENTVALPWSSYFVQHVYKGESTYYATDKNGNLTNTQVTGSNQMDKLVAWNGNGYEHINNFNDGNNTSNASCSLHNHLGTTLMFGMPTENIDPNKQFGYHETWGTMNKDRNEYHYIIVEYNGDWYVGFDYHSETDRQNNGEASKVDRDWNFTDWIVRISPAYPKGSTPTLPDNEGGSGGNGGNTGSGDNNGGNTGNGGNVINRHGNEVEVNYAILDTHDQHDLVDLVTKLSIHVRKATDVEIKIPVPNKYLVESDDLYIFKEHYTGAYSDRNTLENQNAQVSYKIFDANKTQVGEVTLHVDFMKGDPSLVSEFSEGYIRVWTDGITPEVIAACWETNKDGINFEVYNYYQTEKAVWNEGDEFATVVPAEINRGDLFKAMNGAQISFLDENPTYYINAFGFNDDKTDRHGWHATVIPEASEGYDLKYEQTDHLNGTPYNDIYLLRGGSEDVYHEHPEAI